MEYCLPKDKAALFIKALKDRTLYPNSLRNMTSSERRELFGNLLGPENAKDVNALFEEGLLKKYQQQAMITWAKNVLGLPEDVRKDIVSQIQRLDKVLNSGSNSEDAFLSDLAEKKLGVQVTSDEAEKIFELSEQARNLKENLSSIPNPTKDDIIAYGRSLQQLRDYVEDLKPDHEFDFRSPRDWYHLGLNILGVPKNIATGVLHLSAPFVQGWGMMSTGRAWQGFGQMFKYFADEQNYKDLEAYMIGHPDFKFARDGKLALTTLGDKLSEREEGIQSTLLEQANQYLKDKVRVPNIIRASSRGFTGYLNYVRFSRFTDLLNAARNAGEDVSMGSQTVRDLADVVNSFTGRGKLGKDDKYANTAPLLNTVLFAPRKLTATIEMFNPATYLKSSPTARIAAVRQMTGSLLATGAVLGLAKAMGAEVDLDPRSQNFLKIQIGGEKLDITGGNAIYIRLIARLIMNQTKTSKGDLKELGQGYKPQTRASLIGDFMRGKLSPVAGGFTDLMVGSDPVGRPVTISDEARSRMLPIVMESAMNYYQNDPNNAAAILPAMSALFGVSLESPLAPESRMGLDRWGDPEGSDNSTLDDALLHSGASFRFPPKTIKGVTLTDEQYHDYISLRGQYAKQYLTPFVSSPNWDSLSKQAQAKTIKSVLDFTSKEAQSHVETGSLNTDNDIFTKSWDAKQLNQTGTE